MANRCARIFDMRCQADTVEGNPIVTNSGAQACLERPSFKLSSIIAHIQCFCQFCESVSIMAGFQIGDRVRTAVSCITQLLNHYSKMDFAK